jgi:hypothetical protein
MPPPPPLKRRCSFRFGTAAEPGTRVSAVPAWQEATQRVSWNFVSPFLLAATQLMLAAHARNLDKDCVGISELGKVLANTDSCSSRDRATRTLCGACMDLFIGVTHANMLGAFQTVGGRLETIQVAAVRK